MSLTTDMHRGLAARVFQIYNDRFTDSDQEVEYQRGLILGSGEPALDVGCGTGRILLPLVRNGLDVDGVDVSPDLIDMCMTAATAAGLSPTLYVQSAAELDLPRRYRTIYLCGAFGLNGSAADDVSALRRVFEHLEPGGTLSLDQDDWWARGGATYGGSSIWERCCSPDRGRPTAWHVAGTLPTTDGSEITTSERLRRVDPYERYFELDLCYDLVRDGVVVDTEFRRLVSRWYAPNALTAMIQEAGFVDVRVYAAFTDDPPDKAQGTYSYVASKPGPDAAATRRQS